MSKQFYLVACVVGTIIPWTFFGHWFITFGVDLPAFISDWFVNSSAGGAVADLIITGTVFLLWSFFEGRQLGVKGWIWVIPATFLVGVSLGLPLYLYMRELAKETLKSKV